MHCPCQSGSLFSRCCEPIIRGTTPAQTAEQLMRARYTAYSRVDMDFIQESHDPQTRAQFNLEESREWAESTKWTGLEIVETKQGSAKDNVGTVEFKATFESNDGPQIHHELSLFNKRNGKWFYSDSSLPKGQTIVRTQPKVGRNEPCSCGSGKKFKKCCG